MSIKRKDYTVAKISADEKAKRKEIYDGEIIEIFTTMGWKSCTVDLLAKRSKVAKSTMFGYYPNRSDIAGVIQKSIIPIVMRKLDLSSPETFTASWKKLVQGKSKESNLFRMTLKMLLDDVVNNVSEGNKGAVGLTRFYHMLENVFGSATARLLIERNLGYSLMVLAGIQDI